MIALLALMIGLAVYCCTLSNASEGLKFYLIPSLENFKNAGVWTVISAAMGQAFFTLSIGIGSIAIFGSYIGRERSLLGESVNVALLDTFVAFHLTHLRYFTWQDSFLFQKMLFLAFDILPKNKVFYK